MRAPELIQKNMDLFAYIFLLAQRLEYISDKLLKQDTLTTKQFLLLAITEKAFDHNPSLKEVADELGTSHQNVRMMANKLEKKGFIEIFKDREDKRVNRVKTTEVNKDYWEGKSDYLVENVLGMFKEFTDEEVETMYRQVIRLFNDLEPKYRELRSK